MLTWWARTLLYIYLLKTNRLRMKWRLCTNISISLRYDYPNFIYTNLRPLLSAHSDLYSFPEAIMTLSISNINKMNIWSDLLITLMYTFILKISTFLFIFFIKLQCKFETPLSLCKKLWRPIFLNKIVIGTYLFRRTRHKLVTSMQSVINIYWLDRPELALSDNTSYSDKWQMMLKFALAVDQLALQYTALKHRETSMHY